MKNRLKPELCCGQEKVSRWQHLSLGQETQSYDTSITCLVGFWRCLLRACRVKILGCYIADTAKKSVSYSIVLYSLPLAVGRYKKNYSGKMQYRVEAERKPLDSPFYQCPKFLNPPFLRTEWQQSRGWLHHWCWAHTAPALGLTLFNLPNIRIH